MGLDAVLAWIPAAMILQFCASNRFATYRQHSRRQPLQSAAAGWLVVGTAGLDVVVEWISRGHGTSVCTLNRFACAPSSSRAVKMGKSSISPGRKFISFGVSDLRAQAPLCDHRL